MLRKVAKTFLWVVATGTLMKLAALLATAIIGADDDDAAPRFRLTTLLDGNEFSSRAQALAGGTSLTVMGGTDIDLRDATLDSGGARLKVVTWLGGVRVLVSDRWRVEVVEDASGAQHQIELPPEPDPEAPLLEIHLVTRGGAVVVATAGADHHVVRSDWSGSAGEDA